ncbi:MAG: MFS transporter [Acidimicrobiales bacterium]
MTVPTAVDPSQARPGRLPGTARLVVTAAWASNIGDGIRSVALPLLATTVTANATLIGATVGATLLPGAVLGAPVGVVIDRLDRRRVALWSDLARIGVAVGLLAAILSGTTTIAMVIAAAALLGVGETFRDLAGGALIADAVEDSDLEAANGSLIVAEVAGNTMLGPIAGSGLWAVARSIPFAFDAAALAVSAVVTRRLASTSTLERRTQGPRLRLRAELLGAGRYTWSDAVLRRVLLTSTAVQTAMFFVIGVEVVWVLDRLRIGAVGLGAVNAAVAAGGIAAGMAVKRIDLAPVGPRVTTASVATLALAVAGYTSTALPIVFTCLFVGGAALVAGDIILRAARVRAAGADHVGRVTGIIRTAMWAGGSVGAVAGGAVAEAHGVVTTFTIAAVALGAIAVATAVWSPIPDPTAT